MLRQKIFANLAVMYRLTVILIFLSGCQAVNKQDIRLPECKLPGIVNNNSINPEAIYHLSDDEYLSLWLKSTQPDTFPGKIAYSDFVLTECKTGKVICAYDNRTHCTIEMYDDTLILRQLSLIALSPKLDMIYVPWLTTFYYYQGNKLVSKEEFNHEIHYTEEQITRAFERLDTTKWQTHQQLGNSRKSYLMMRFASQMMVAAISGSEKGAYYFRLVKKKFRPAGEYAQWYAEMEHILERSRKGSKANPVSR